METAPQPVTPIKDEGTPESNAIQQPSYLVDLNDQQFAAATAPVEGATRILGSPGERSVEVLVARITHLVRHHGLEPSQIVVLTFSKERASGILNRLREASNLGWDTANELVIGSFHQICRRYLMLHGSHVSVPPYLEISDHPKKRMAANSVLTWDDLLVKGAELFDLPGSMDSFSSVLVDTFHDTTIPQYNVARALAKSSQSITFVGDPDQSLFSWKTGRSGPFEKIAQDFAINRTFPLEQNYRSTMSILRAANSLLEQDTRRRIWRLDRTLRSDLPTGAPVVLHEAINEEEEAQFIARTILSLKEELCGLVDYNDFAVLPQTRYIRPHIVQALKHAEIPHEGEAESVYVSTIHSAANLERAIVFVPAIENGTFPYATMTNLDEERRILLVAMTRSRTHCILSFAQSRCGLAKSFSSFIQGNLKSQLVRRLPAITDSMRRDVATVLGKEWRPRLDEVEEEKVKVEEEEAVPAQSPLRTQAIPTTPKHEREASLPLTPQRKRVKREVEDSPTPRS